MELLFDKIGENYFGFRANTPFGTEIFLENPYVHRKSPSIERPELNTDQVLGSASCPRDFPNGRLDRISSLLLRVIARQEPTPQDEFVVGLTLSGVEKSIMATVEALGSAAPCQIAAATKISRATVTRGLSRLANEGVLRREGATRGIRYCSVRNQKT